MAVTVNKKIGLCGIFYPMAILRYFEAALQRRDDVELVTIGPYTGRWIPWRGGMELPEKYARPPKIALGKQALYQRLVPTQLIDNLLPDDVDVLLLCDAGWAPKSHSRKVDTVVLIQTDPHVLNYDVQRAYADYSFCMQAVYCKEKDRYLPYAADEVWHAPLEREKEFDVVLIGLHYPNRTRLVERLRARGLKVYYDIGPVFEQYQELYARAKVAINWSSKQDLVARVFESLAMAVPLVTNRVPYLPTHFVEDEHYLGFDTFEEAEEKVMWALEHYDEAQDMAWAGHRKVFAQHLYKHRVEQIFDTIGLVL